MSQLSSFDLPRSSEFPQQRSLSNRATRDSSMQATSTTSRRSVQGEGPVLHQLNDAFDTEKLTLEKVRQCDATLS